MNCSKLNRQELHEFYTCRKLILEANNFPFRLYEVKDYFMVQALPNENIYEFKAFDYIEALDTYISFGKEMLDKCGDYLKMEEKRIRAVEDAIFIANSLKEEIFNEEKRV